MKNSKKFVSGIVSVFVLTAFVFASTAQAQPDPGGWSCWKKPCATALGVFDRAMNEQVGVTYTPLCFKSQVVINGVNYKFYCKSVASTNPPIRGMAIVSIFEDTDGNVTVTNICPVKVVKKQKKQRSCFFGRR
ncbi:MAG TPA: hypothetical protein DEB39_02705 [Planctomycetaceae bacterium]|nr:hypothetical protein [Planctomycetaceae bacterium]